MRNCPHESFKLPYDDPEGVPRQSIEVRCLVFSHGMKIPRGYHEQVGKMNADDLDGNRDLSGH